jgi:hypothetical protein
MYIKVLHNGDYNYSQLARAELSFRALVAVHYWVLPIQVCMSTPWYLLLLRVLHSRLLLGSPTCWFSIQSCLWDSTHGTSAVKSSPVINACHVLDGAYEALLNSINCWRHADCCLWKISFLQYYVLLKLSHFELIVAIWSDKLWSL